MTENIAAAIRQKALELGYHECGIIKTAAMADYAERLTERTERFPETAKHLSGFLSFADPEKNYPWAKSIVIASMWYGKYRIPDHLQGLIAKYYLVDSRRDARAPAYQASQQFNSYLEGFGWQTKTEPSFGLTALRWAAAKAGIGIIRRNNFYYTKKGSWASLEAWLIGEELELIHQPAIPACPDNCNRCIQSCPTGSLAEPYMMNRSTCVSCLTSWEGWDLPNDKYQKAMGDWIFGCDACQDSCPFNKNSWSADAAFPGLAELASAVSLEQIIEMDYDYLRDIISSKFWYIKKDNVWRWKTNALNAMLNNYQAKYAPYIEKACRDKEENVQVMAKWVKEQLSI